MPECIAKLLVRRPYRGCGSTATECTDDHRLQSARRFSENILHTNKLAMLFWRHAMMNWGRLREMRRTLVSHCLEAGNHWADALPTNCRTWDLIVEDVWGSGFIIRRLHRDALMECLGQQEYPGSSGPYTAKRTTAVRRRCASRRRGPTLGGVLSILGRTGAPVLVTCVRTEDAAQVRYVSSDTPSGVLYTALAAVLPNMTGLATDPVHVVINVEMGYGRRRTRCSRDLRIIMNKFNKACVVRGIQKASGGEKTDVRLHVPTKRGLFDSDHSHVRDFLRSLLLS